MYILHSIVKAAIEASAEKSYCFPRQAPTGATFSQPGTNLFAQPRMHPYLYSLPNVPPYLVVTLVAHVLDEIAGEVRLEAALDAGEEAPEVFSPLVPGEGAVAAKLLQGANGFGNRP